MATTKHYGGGSVTFTEAAAAATITTGLPNTGTGLNWRIDNMSFFATGAFSVWSIDVQEAGGTSIYKIGGTTAVHPGVIQGPIYCKMGDAPNVILTCTGSTAVVINVNASLVAGGA